MGVEAEVYIFSIREIVFIMSSKFFMHVVEIWKYYEFLKWLIEKTHIYYKVYLQTSFFFCMCKL
jgi:hypothetical protein